MTSTTRGRGPQEPRRPRRKLRASINVPLCCRSCWTWQVFCPGCGQEIVGEMAPGTQLPHMYDPHGCGNCGDLLRIRVVEPKPWATPGDRPAAVSDLADEVPALERAFQAPASRVLSPAGERPWIQRVFRQESFVPCPQGTIREELRGIAGLLELAREQYGRLSEDGELVDQMLSELTPAQVSAVYRRLFGCSPRRYGSVRVYSEPELVAVARAARSAGGLAVR